MFRSACASLLLVFFVPALSLTQTAPPAFEAAAVDANKSGEVRMAVDFQPGGRFSAHNVPLKILIALAYHVRPETVTSGPGWLETERFDVVAKASQTTPPEELRQMLQTLLAERFNLRSHSEKKLLPAYALLPLKTGVKAPPSDAAILTEQRCRPGEAIAGQKSVICEHMTMALFADTLQEIAPRDLDVPVVDETGLGGTYKFQFAWAPAVRTSSAAPPSPAAGPTLFEALQTQLGLRLESRKEPLPVIVVDRVERVPTAN